MNRGDTQIGVHRCQEVLDSSYPAYPCLPVGRGRQARNDIFTGCHISFNVTFRGDFSIVSEIFFKNEEIFALLQTY